MKLSFFGTNYGGGTTTVVPIKSKSESHFRSVSVIESDDEMMILGPTTGIKSSY